MIPATRPQETRQILPGPTEDKNDTRFGHKTCRCRGSQPQGHTGERERERDQQESLDDGNPGKETPGAEADHIDTIGKEQGVRTLD